MPRNLKVTVTIYKICSTRPLAPPRRRSRPSPPPALRRRPRRRGSRGTWQPPPRGSPWKRKTISLSTVISSSAIGPIEIVIK